jgi:hypothetical protein
MFGLILLALPKDIGNVRVYAAVVVGLVVMVVGVSCGFTLLSDIDKHVYSRYEREFFTPMPTYSNIVLDDEKGTVLRVPLRYFRTSTDETYARAHSPQCMTHDQLMAWSDDLPTDFKNSGSRFLRGFVTKDGASTEVHRFCFAPGIHRDSSFTCVYNGPQTSKSWYWGRMDVDLGTIKCDS